MPSVYSTLPTKYAGRRSRSQHWKDQLKYLDMNSRDVKNLQSLILQGKNSNWCEKLESSKDNDNLGTVIAKNNDSKGK